MVDAERLAKKVNVNVESKRREIRASLLDIVFVSPWKSTKDFFRLGSGRKGSQSPWSKVRSPKLALGSNQITCLRRRQHGGGRGRRGRLRRGAVATAGEFKWRGPALAQCSPP